MFRDGQRVSYVGFSGPHLIHVGDEGKVLEGGTEGSTVLWSRTGSVTTEYNADLIGTGKTAAQDGLDDCLDVGEPLGITAARQAFDEGGELAVLSYMSESGHLSSVAEIADDALTFVASKLRQDQYFRSILAQLDDDEGDSLVSLASRVILRQIGLE